MFVKNSTKYEKFNKIGSLSNETTLQIVGHFRKIGQLESFAWLESIELCKRRKIIFILPV